MRGRDNGVDRLLERIRSRIELSLALRRGLTGLSLGLLVGGVVKLLLQALRAPTPTLASFALTASVAALAVAAWSFRQRWTLLDAAEYVDARISTGDAVSAFLHVAPASPLRAPIEARARRSLHRFIDRRAFPSIWGLTHLAIVPATLTLGYLEAFPLQASTGAATPAASTPAVREPQQHSTLPADAEESTASAAAPALDREAHPLALPDAAQGSGPASESLAAQLADTPATSEQTAWLTELAAASSGDARIEAVRLAAARGDAARADAALRQLALSNDAQARQLARQALRRAVERSADDPSAHRALTDQQALHDQREQVGQLLRDAQRWLGELPVPRDAQETESVARDESFETLERVLKRLSPGERRQLAERLQPGLDDGSARFELPRHQRVLELLESLDQPEAVTALANELRRLWKPEAPASRQRRLESPATSLQPGPHHPQARAKPHLPPGAGIAQFNGSKRHTGPSAGRGGSSVEHTSRRADTQERAFYGSAANPRLGFELPLVSSSPWRARPSGVSGASAPLPPLGLTTPNQLEAVEHTPIPDQYREQVSRYFSPN